MIDHLSVGSRRYTESVAFYRKVLAPLGVAMQRDTGKEAAFGTEDQWCFFIYPVSAEEAVLGSGMHIAWRAASRSAVEAVHKAALESGGADLFTPRERPDISPTYYGAMFTDVDGHRVEVKTDAVKG
jgi:catechol 2,3-dioxygenase-like lactoylglutathione lyase family enzyme